MDVGVEFNEGKNLRAPDIVIGTTEERPGWSRKIPPLVVEFADVGQDERDLQAKIRELHEAWTQYGETVAVPQRLALTDRRQAP